MSQRCPAWTRRAGLSARSRRSGTTATSGWWSPNQARRQPDHPSAIHRAPVHALGRRAL